MKRILKVFGWIVLAVLVALVAVLIVLWEPLSSFPKMPSSYEAKELCSCLFVEGRPQADCERFIKQSVVSIDGRTIDAEKKTVAVSALWTESRARFVSPRYGCVAE